MSADLRVPLVGSVWLSLDPRDEGRYVLVDAVSEGGDFAFVRPYRARWAAKGRGRRSRIHVSRFDGQQWIEVAA